jgi:acyl-coenzyme A synthetase/AMP-(fatty) acid ligase
VASQRDLGWRRATLVPLDFNGPTNRPPVALSADFAARPLFDLLSAAAGRDPDALAVVDGNQRLTYRALLQRIGCATRRIAAAPPGAIAMLLPNTGVGLAATLGCLVARRVVLLLEPRQPEERIAAILHDAQPAAVVGTGSEAGIIPIAELVDGPDAPGWTPSHAFAPDEPALVFFTSGSTGRPKGVATSLWGCLHRASLNLLAWRQGPDDRLLNASQAATHASFCRFLGTLCVGSRLVLYGAATEGLGVLRDRLGAEHVTILVAGPALMRALLPLPGFDAAFRTLRLLRCAGAALLRADVAAMRRVLPDTCLIDHSYASTEAGVVAAWTVPRDFPGDEPRLPGGYLLPDQDYALDDGDGDPGPGGAAELVLRGRGIAVGEWQDGRCVPGRMQPHPVNPGWRIFRTGDVVRLGADRLLRFVGRVDQQIKINGVRIEPAEIEAVLRRVPGVTDAAVIARDGDGQPILLAYVAVAGGVLEATSGTAATANRPAMRAALLARLRAELPPAMQPAHLMLLDALPRLAGAKLDVGALPKPAEPGALQRLLRKVIGRRCRQRPHRG